MVRYEITYTDDRPTETIEADHLDFVVIDSDWETPTGDAIPVVRVGDQVQWGSDVKLRDGTVVQAPAHKVGKQIAHLDRALDADGTVVWEAERHTVATITEQ